MGEWCRRGRVGRCWSCCCLCSWRAGLLGRLINLDDGVMEREKDVQDNTIEIARSVIMMWWYPM